jgi:hypothetical protein
MNRWSAIYTSDLPVPYDGDIKVSFMRGSAQRLVAPDEPTVPLQSVGSSDGTSLLPVAPTTLLAFGAIYTLPTP